MTRAENIKWRGMEVRSSHFWPGIAAEKLKLSHKNHYSLKHKEKSMVFYLVKKFLIKPQFDNQMCSVQVVRLRLFGQFSKEKQKEFHSFIQKVINFGIERMDLFCILLAKISLYLISGIHKCRQQ